MKKKKIGIPMKRENEKKAIITINMSVAQITIAPIFILIVIFSDRIPFLIFLCTELYKPNTTYTNKV